MGGGVRTKEDIRVRLDDAGISRVILGTVAVEDPELVKWAVARYKDRIAVGIDAKEGVWRSKAGPRTPTSILSALQKICTRWAWPTLFIPIFPKTA